eukprot:14759877-Ditylum_brightwellii.AAC.1
MDKRILLTVGNAKKVLSMTKDQASRYGWGQLISHISNAANTDPDVKELNLITQYGSLTLDDLKREANHYFSGNKNLNAVPDEAAMLVANIDPANDAAHQRCFAKRVRSNMITKNIQGWVSADSWTCLELKEKDFAWKKGDEWVYDGPM